MLMAWVLVARYLVEKKPPQRPSNAQESSLQSPLDLTEPPAQGYDVRRGAAAYAPIIGGLAGFVVTAVVLVFETVASHHGEAPILFGRVTSLLVLGLIACLLGAFAFAAIGAEWEPTADLPAASLYAGSATAIGAVAIMAAFEALAAIYLQETKPLFVLMTAGAAIVATVLVVLVLGDAWSLAPSHHWLGDQEKAFRAAIAASILAVIPLVAGTGLYFSGTHIALGTNGTQWLIGLGIGFSVITGLGSLYRTMHSATDKHRSIARTEALFFDWRTSFLPSGAFAGHAIQIRYDPAYWFADEQARISHFDQVWQPKLVRALEPDHRPQHPAAIQASSRLIASSTGASDLYPKSC